MNRRYLNDQHKNPQRMSAKGLPLDLVYLSEAQLREYVQQAPDHIMGIVGFGCKDSSMRETNCPVLWLDMAPLSGETVFEVWTSEEQVTRGSTDGIAWTCNSEALFGCIEVPPDESIEASAFNAYSRIFDLIESQGYSNLLRVWNYFPQINSHEQGVERYRSFNVGRHEAFITKGRHIGEQTVPAACALGSRSGSLAIYFLAGKHPGVALENPRQTSAYCYPEEFGPRSPTFSRAMLVGTDCSQQIFISGTASIVGHESLHLGNVAEQTRETLLNIRVLLEQMQNCDGETGRLFFKVYLRHPDYLPQVREQLMTEFGPAHQAIYLQADICRAELMLEIEGVCFSNQPVSAA